MVLLLAYLNGESLLHSFSLTLANLLIWLFYSLMQYAIFGCGGSRIA